MTRSYPSREGGVTASPTSIKKTWIMREPILSRSYLFGAMIESSAAINYLHIGLKRNQPGKPKVSYNTIFPFTRNEWRKYLFVMRYRSHKLVSSPNIPSLSLDSATSRTDLGRGAPPFSCRVSLAFETNESKSQN